MCLFIQYIFWALPSISRITLAMVCAQCNRWASYGVIKHHTKITEVNYQNGSECIGLCLLFLAQGCHFQLVGIFLYFKFKVFICCCQNRSFFKRWRVVSTDIFKWLLAFEKPLCSQITNLDFKRFVLP